MSIWTIKNRGIKKGISNGRIKVCLKLQKLHKLYQLLIYTIMSYSSKNISLAFCRKLMQSVKFGIVSDDLTKNNLMF